MHSNYSRKNQAKVILPIFNEYLLIAKLGYFIINNTFLNNTCITKIIDLICSNLDTKKKKL